MWIQIGSFDSTELFDRAYLAFDPTTRVKINEALQKLRQNPPPPELDLRPHGSLDKRIYSIKVDGSLRLSFKNNYGTAELRNLLIDEPINGNE